MNEQYEKAERRHTEILSIIYTIGNTEDVSRVLAWTYLDIFRITGSNDIRQEEIEILSRVALNCLHDERNNNAS